MVQKLKESEKRVLLSSYISKGLKKDQAKRRLSNLLSLMVVSPLTIIV